MKIDLSLSGTNNWWKAKNRNEMKKQTFTIENQEICVMVLIKASKESQSAIFKVTLS